MKKEKLSAEDAVVSQRTQGRLARLWRAKRANSLLRDLRASSAPSALSLWKLGLVAMLTIGISGCGTKTELLKPDGKPTPHNERDPSQPPSPISR